MSRDEAFIGRLEVEDQQHTDVLGMHQLLAEQSQHDIALLEPLCFLASLQVELVALPLGLSLFDLALSLKSQGEERHVLQILRAHLSFLGGDGFQLLIDRHLVKVACEQPERQTFVSHRDTSDAKLLNDDAL